MPTIAYSQWGIGFGMDGLTYPECPYMMDYNPTYQDGRCGFRAWRWSCSTTQYCGTNRCPFDGELLCDEKQREENR